MLKKAFLFVCFTSLLLGVHAKGLAQDKVMLDKIVAIVGNSIILYSDLEDYAKEMKEYRREQGVTSDRDPKIEALEMLMMQKLLYNQSQIDSVKLGSPGAAAQQAEDQVSAMARQVGGTTTLEAMFHRPIYEIKREYASRIEERAYSDQMRSEVMGKITITPGEVERFYKRTDKDSLPIIPTQYVYAQITKFPISTKEAKQRAKERLLEMRERIINGTRFDVLAKLYSDDPGSKSRGGEMDPSPSGNFETPFANSLEKLQTGQVSEIVETVYGFHIIQLLGRPNGLYHARHILVRPEFSDTEMYETNAALDSVAMRIRMDSISFEDAVLKYSEDKYSKYNKGLVSNLEVLERYQSVNVDLAMATTKHIMDELPPADYNAFKDLKPGEVSDAFQTEDMMQNKISKIVKLIEIIPAHQASLKEDYLRLEDLALEDKRKKEFLKWVDKKIDGMYVRIAPEFRNYDEFENKAWLK